MEIERESTRVYSVNSFWKKLCTCRKTDYRMNELWENRTLIGSILRCINDGNKCPYIPLTAVRGTFRYPDQKSFIQTVL